MEAIRTHAPINLSKVSVMTGSSSAIYVSSLDGL